jgi:hypothetical protein
VQVFRSETRISFGKKGNTWQRRKKMPSQVIDLCEDSDENEEYPTSLLLSKKRPRDKEASSSHAPHPRSENGHANKTVRGSAEFVVDPELANEVEVSVSPHKKRRVVQSQQSIAAGDCAQLIKEVHATEKDVGSKDAQVADHRESHEGIAAAASHRMNADSQQTNSQKLPASEPPSNASGRQRMVTAWEDRLCELADYRKIHRHCNVPQRYSENIKLGTWVGTQRTQYWLQEEGKTSTMTLSRIQELESLGFKWSIYSTAWEDRLSELAEYRKIHGHCNVPANYSESNNLGNWVGKQRGQYRLHLEGKASQMTTFRIQELESLGFEWTRICVSAWEDRLSELADYRKDHGHCNVPNSYSETTTLANWVHKQRSQYRLYLEGKRSQITLPRIQELESLGFEWKPSIGRRKETPKIPSLDDDTTSLRERALVAPEYTQQHGLKKTSAVEKSAAIKSTSLLNPNSPSGMAKATSTSSRVEPKHIKRVEVGDALFDETDLDSSLSESSATTPSLHSDRQGGRSLSPDKSAPAVGSIESSTRNDTLQAKLPGLVHWKKSITSFSHALLAKGPTENEFLVATKKPANSRQRAEYQVETAPCNDESLGANPVAAEPPQRRHNLFTHALLLGHGSTGNGVQATPDKPANAPPDTQQTPPDEVFQSDNVLNEVELELIWLGEESMYCLSCPEFQFDFIYEYASPALKVELRKLSRDDQSERGKLNHIVRMEEWLVSRRFDFVRKDIRKMLHQGFRRQRMRIVIAELRLLRRQQSMRHFPAMILD